MSEKELNETMEELAEVGELSTPNNTFAKVAVIGAVILITTGIVIYVRKKKNSKTTEETEIVEEDSKTKNKTQK